ncbi:IMP 5'-nucleotidase, partial [Kappamyces sp. JEL0680]
PTPETADKNRKRYLEILACLEELIEDHIKMSKKRNKESARLQRLVPSVGEFFTTLPLVAAFKHIDSQRCFVERRFVPPSFNDIRHLLNHAQVISIAPQLELITFDGDMTLYADGADFEKDSELVELLCTLLRAGKKVAIVTAAGYPKDAARYEQRLSGLLLGFQESGVAASLLQNFYVLGGECNYLFQYDAEQHHLVYIEQDVYQPQWMKLWSRNEEQIQALLDVAQTHLATRIEEMGLEDRVGILRKKRAVGVNPKPGASLTREQLDELALSIQSKLNAHQMSPAAMALPLVPFCAFNGGSDVWVDIGNKLIGVKVSGQD